MHSGTFPLDAAVTNPHPQETAGSSPVGPFRPGVPAELKSEHM